MTAQQRAIYKEVMPLVIDARRKTNEAKRAADSLRLKLDAMSKALSYSVAEAVGR